MKVSKTPTYDQFHRNSWYIYRRVKSSLDYQKQEFNHKVHIKLKLPDLVVNVHIK